MSSNNDDLSDFMTPGAARNALGCVDFRFVSSPLQGPADAIESATRDLHQAALALSDVLQPVQGKRTRDQPLHRRLGQVVQSIAMQREACARRSAVVERSLFSIVPATRASTYSGGSAPYSMGAKQSGVFKLLSA